MRKGIGPNNLGALKGVGKMYGAKSVAKQTGKVRINPSSDSIKVAHKKGVAQDTKNTRALNDNLNAARSDYQANRNPQTKAALQEAKDMKKGGSFFATKGRVTSRKLGEDYPA
jgi:hypothetical protein